MDDIVRTHKLDRKPGEMGGPPAAKREDDPALPDQALRRFAQKQTKTKQTKTIPQHTQQQKEDRHISKDSTKIPPKQKQTKKKIAMIAATHRRVAHDNAPALCVVLVDAHLEHVARARNAERLVNLKLNGQAVRVPPKAPLNMVAGLVRVPGHGVLDRPGETAQLKITKKSPKNHHY
jgi:hypothetical protein